MNSEITPDIIAEAKAVVRGIKQPAELLRDGKVAKVPASVLVGLWDAKQVKSTGGSNGK